MGRHSALIDMEHVTVLRPFGVQAGGEDACGYCGKAGSRETFGAWSEQMSVVDYQALIDLGWRRSGKYLYKPVRGGGSETRMKLRT